MRGIPRKNRSSYLSESPKDILGRDVLTAYAPVVPLGWLVFVELPIEEAK